MHDLTSLTLRLAECESELKRVSVTMESLKLSI